MACGHWPPRLQPWPQNNFGPPNIGPPPTTDPHPATDPPTLSPPPFGRGGCCRLNQPATAPLQKIFKVHGGSVVDQFSRQQPPSLSEGGFVVGRFSRQQPPSHSEGGSVVGQFSRQQPPSLSDGGSVVGQFSRHQPPSLFTLCYIRERGRDKLLFFKYVIQ
jgi:hypothetical protein